MQTKRLLALLSALGALVFAAHPARAGLIVQAGSATSAPGGAGSFDVDLLATGGNYNVGGFSFELSVPQSSGVTFTSVSDNTTTPYVFGTLQSPPLTFSTFPNTDFIASDSDLAAPSASLGTGDVLGLGRISYSVAPGAALGPVSVSLVPGAGTTLTDGSAATVPFTTQSGTITVANASAAPEVPEGGTLTLMSSGLCGLLLVARRRAARRS